MYEPVSWTNIKNLSITLGLAGLHSVYLLTSEGLLKDEKDEINNKGASVSLPLSLRFNTSGHLAWDSFTGNQINVRIQPADRVCAQAG